MSLRPDASRLNSRPECIVHRHIGVDSMFTICSTAPARSSQGDSQPAVFLFETVELILQRISESARQGDGVVVGMVSQWFEIDGDAQLSQIGGVDVNRDSRHLQDSRHGQGHG